MSATTTRRARTFSQHLTSKLNLRPQHAPMTDANRERAKELPRLGVPATSSSPLLVNKS